MNKRKVGSNQYRSGTVSVVAPVLQDVTLAPAKAVKRVTRPTTSGTGNYLRQMGQIQMLDRDEEVALGTLMAQGMAAQQQLINTMNSLSSQRRSLRQAVRRGAQAKEEFIEANLRLVASEAARAFRQKKYPGMSLDDLIQEGNIGLIRAVEGYSPTAGTKFSTYAVPWIRQAMGRASANQGRTIRLPVYATDYHNLIIRKKKELESRLNAVPTVEMVAKEAGVDVERVRQVLQYPEEPQSLSAPVGADGDMSLGDAIPQDTETTQILDDISNQSLVETLHAALSERELDILSMRFGLGDSDPKTLTEVSAMQGCSRERIRQVEAKAIYKLRNDPTIKNLLTL